jgi:hypothetical protein
MPGGDRTGPLGDGPKTGRAAGFCARYPKPGYMSPIIGRGLGRNRGRGHRNWFYATGLTGSQRDTYISQSKDKTITEGLNLTELKEHAEYLENELKEIRKRIQEIGE